MDPYRDDFYQEPELYDLEYAHYVEDLSFYAGLAREAGRVIELGAGSGRVTLEMLRTGARVSAVDAARPMLARLRARARRQGLLDGLEVRAGDFSALEGWRAPLVVLPFNGLHHVYDAASLLALFRALQGALEPGGRFVTDLLVPDPAFFHQDLEGVHELRIYPDPKGGRMRTWENGFYDRATQINRVRYHYKRADGREQVLEVPLRMWYPQELLGLARVAGWRDIQTAADFNGGTFDRDATRMVLTLST